MTVNTEHQPGNDSTPNNNGSTTTPNPPHSNDSADDFETADENSDSKSYCSLITDPKLKNSPHNSVASKAKFAGDPLTSHNCSSQQLSTEGQKDDPFLKGFTGLWTNDYEKSDVPPYSATTSQSLVSSHPSRTIVHASKSVIVTPPIEQYKGKKVNKNDISGVVEELNPFIDSKMTNDDGNLNTVKKKYKEKWFYQYKNNPNCCQQNRHKILSGFTTDVSLKLLT